MKFRFDYLFKKKVLHFLGFYSLAQINKKNKKINSWFLNILAGFFIVLFFILMLSSIFLIGSAGYYKLYSKYIKQKKTVFDKTSSVAILIPSIQKNSIEEMSNQRMETKTYFLFFPFYLFIPIIFIITFIHEFGHYIMCRRAGIKIKEYGIGCISLFYIPTPIIFAYVDQQENHLKKASKYDYFSIISGGCAMNFLLCILLIIIFNFYFSQTLNYLFILNISVMLVNCLPIGPLDGGLFIKKISKNLKTLLTVFIILNFIILL